MSATRTLFAVNPALDRKALAARFAATRRIQIRDVLTADAAEEIHAVLARATPWGLAYEAGEGARQIGNRALAEMPQNERLGIGQAISAQAQRGGYAFAYSRYPMVTAYTEKWAEGGPHDILLEHINDDAFIGLVRQITGFSNLVKADAQATLYGPNQFLGMHDDSHVAEGWRVAYVLNFARDWHPNWGGYLLFFDEDGDVVDGFMPRFNALNMFAVPQRHAVSFVPSFAPLGRYAITGWFREW